MNDDLRAELHRAFRELGYTTNWQTSHLLDLVDEMLDAQAAKPIDMVLHCPACLEQHIDGPEEPFAYGGVTGVNDYRTASGTIVTKKAADRWANPPHRSHLCHHCGHIWRPADVPTNGVLETKTHGKNDMVMFDGPAEVMRRLRAQAEFGRGQQLDLDWGA